MSKNEVSNTSQLLSNSRLGGKDFSYQQKIFLCQSNPCATEVPRTVQINLADSERKQTAHISQYSALNHGPFKLKRQTEL